MMILTPITLALSLAVAASAGAQNTDSLRADSAFRRQDWRAVAEQYARITARAPNMGQGWFRLGMARHALNDLDGAIPAFERALALQFQQPQSIFRLARIHAMKGNAEKSLDYLESLAPNGTRVLQRLTFFPVHRDTVRQLFETSSDSGKTWQPGFDGRYVRKPSV